MCAALKPPPRHTHIVTSLDWGWVSGYPRVQVLVPQGQMSFSMVMFWHPTMLCFGASEGTGHTVEQLGKFSIRAKFRGKVESIWHEIPLPFPFPGFPPRSGTRQLAILLCLAMRSSCSKCHPTLPPNPQTISHHAVLHPNALVSVLPTAESTL